MNIVIIGGGLAAAHAAQELRNQGHSGGITLITAESHLPYERPPLSKGILLGSSEPDAARVLDQQWYDDNNVTLRLGSRVTSIDPEGQKVLIGEEVVPYDRLLLATGSSARHLDTFDNSDLNVVYLRTLDDSLALKEHLSGNILLIGAGWIGLEVASAARNAGANVTVAEFAPLPLQRVLGDELAAVIADLHRSHGVDLRLATSVERIDGKEVVFSDGTTLKPDLVVVGIGSVPNTELAEAAGLAVDNGVLVDATLRTSDPNIYAAGDVANEEHPSFGRVRVEHWDNAIEQGKHAARTMLGSADPYTRKPYFFTDQYDLGMEYYGYIGPEGHDELIIRGDKESRLLTALWVRGDQVVAGMHFNDWDAIKSIRYLVDSDYNDIAALRDPTRELPSS
jgi:3-phenylpropionate/trans-cinnamate dioxygenase ferredoxin reductase subunit